MKNEVQKQEKPQIAISDYSGSKSLMPNNIDEAYRIAQAFSKSSFIPRHFQGKEADCFAAINLGMEVGLPPMRSLQSIAVVNGTPCIYGDAQLALVRASGLLGSFKEEYSGSITEGNLKATCILTRIGDTEVVSESFDMTDAKTANLWSKQGTWKTHPKRMLRYKARAFALRDKFADVLLGLTHSIEEMQGEEVMKDATPTTGNFFADQTKQVEETTEKSSVVDETQTLAKEQDLQDSFYNLVKDTLEDETITLKDKESFWHDKKKQIDELPEDQQLELENLLTELQG